MSLLLRAASEANERFSKRSTFSSGIGIPTGFTALDILSSNVVRNMDGIQILNGGLFNNAYNGVGISGSGKTTLWIGMAASAVDYWCNTYGNGEAISEMIFYNIEQHTSVSRIQTITGWTPTEISEKLRFITKPMSIKEIFEDISILARQKEEYRSALEISTGRFDVLGNEIKVLPTTYIIIDSIAALRPDRSFTTDSSLFDKRTGDLIDDDGIAGSNNIDGMRMAKDNTIFINEVKKLCESVSLCVIMINHMSEKKSVSMFDKPKAVTPTMKPGLNLKGGDELIFQSFGVYHIKATGDTNKVFDKFKEKNKDGARNYDDVTGIILNLEMFKNKNGPEGRETRMFFDNKNGYQHDLSDFESIISAKYGISGSGYYSLDVLPEITFTTKSLRKTCIENPLLLRAIQFTIKFKYCCEVFDGIEAPSLLPMRDLPYETRVYLIMSFTKDYPLFRRERITVGDSDRKIFYDILTMTGNKYYPDRFMNYSTLSPYLEKPDEYGEIIFSDKPISLASRSEKYGDDEYFFSD